MGVSRTLKKYETPLTADCLEFCPISGFHHLLVCGNYQLECGATSQRIGKLSLHDIGHQTLDPISVVDTDAVLDIKFIKSLVGDKILLSSVESTGYFRLWSMGEKELECLNSKKLCDDEILLSCDWFGDRCAISTSAGVLYLLDVTASEIEVRQHWKSHDHEAWIVVFDGLDGNILYSGSDDCTLRRHDLRLPTGKGQMVGKRGDMGVTSIQAHPTIGHLFASGSYDEKVKLWDSRSLRSPLEEVSVGGGAWRLKWEPNYGKFLLVGAMHNGFQILAFDNGHLKSAGSYMKHESLAYGCDWYHGNASDIRFEEPNVLTDLEYVVGTCSMYDRALHTWIWDSNE